MDDKETIALPLGRWDLNGNWFFNPLLEMSPDEQKLHNEKHGFRIPKNCGILFMVNAR